MIIQRAEVCISENMKKDNLVDNVKITIMIVSMMRR